MTLDRYHDTGSRVRVQGEPWWVQGVPWGWLRTFRGALSQVLKVQRVDELGEG